jgi:hypothetical protein
MLIRDLKASNKNTTQLITYPGNITAARVLLHAYISGSNGFSVDFDGFMEASRSYGLDSPVASIT